MPPGDPDLWDEVNEEADRILAEQEQARAEAAERERLAAIAAEEQRQQAAAEAAEFKAWEQKLLHAIGLTVFGALEDVPLLQIVKPGSLIPPRRPVYKETTGTVSLFKIRRISGRECVNPEIASIVDLPDGATGIDLEVEASYTEDNKSSQKRCAPDRVFPVFKQPTTGPYRGWSITFTRHPITPAGHKIPSRRNAIRVAKSLEHDLPKGTVIEILSEGSQYRILLYHPSDRSVFVTGRSEQSEPPSYSNQSYHSYSYFLRAKMTVVHHHRVCEKSEEAVMAALREMLVEYIVRINQEP